MSGTIPPLPFMPLSRAQQELQFSLSLRTIDYFPEQDINVALVLVTVRSSNSTSVVLESQRLGYLVSSQCDIFMSYSSRSHIKVSTVFNEVETHSLERYDCYA
jgi:hypothetical protein